MCHTEAAKYVISNNIQVFHYWFMGSCFSSDASALSTATVTPIAPASTSTLALMLPDASGAIEGHCCSDSSLVASVACAFAPDKAEPLILIVKTLCSHKAQIYWSLPRLRLHLFGTNLELALQIGTVSFQLVQIH